ncbi:hypothetical protein C2845_PM14G14440 [Panicum miliaceum]|uniref:Uncharacterized protein n=1 Tax=Panicum miliaceum TaxID=4540 RepID=A0A3L6PM09_PANMI|nr:hypothetical protein C2845_PM14G14440 [Panicum miliaceum]
MAVADSGPPSPRRRWTAAAVMCLWLAAAAATEIGHFACGAGACCRGRRGVQGQAPALAVLPSSSGGLGRVSRPCWSSRGLAPHTSPNPSRIRNRDRSDRIASAMGSVTVTEAEATPLVGVVLARDAKGPSAAASVEMKALTGGFLLSPAWKEEVDRLIGVVPPPPPAKQSLLSRLARLWRRCFVRFDPYSIPFDQLLSKEHGDACTGNEYEPAPGKVYRNPHFHNGICWTHGNFVAHEPVTESYSVLGFPLGFSTRRSGKLDSFCKTCYSRFDVPHPGIQKIFACGHKHVKEVCEMCYLRSRVLHPHPGGFAFGYHDPYRPYPTKH